MNNYISEAQLLPLIRMALTEDIGNGDVTSEAIFSGAEVSKARIVAKADGVFCGGDVIRLCVSGNRPARSHNTIGRRRQPC